jgi:uncharacterized protein YndB with AHSA1/START domain
VTNTYSNTLKVTLPSDLEIVMTRLFDAPRQLVFDAFTRPEMIKQWFGRRGDTLPVCEVDLRPGGRFRYVWALREGGEMGMGGEFRDVVPPERIVHTEVFDDYAEMGESVNTTLFEERDGKTYLTITSVYPSKQTRDAMIESGMESGAGETFDRLAEFLASSRA